MAKDKSKSKGKKKLKAVERGVGKGAKAIIENVAPRVESLLQPEATKKKPEAQPAIEATFETAAAVKIPSSETLSDLAELFKLFADPTRLRILYALMGGGKCVADISEAACVSQSATSHQLRGMKQAGLVNSRREGKQVIYSLANGEIQSMLAQGVSALEG